MSILRGIGKGLAGTAAVAGAGAAWAGRGLGFGNTMAAGLAAGGLFKGAASRAFGGSGSSRAGPGAKSIPLDKMSGGIPSVLDEIQKEVSLIRNILETQPDPESQEHEKILEEEARNKRLLEAIRSLRLAGPGEKEEGFLDKLKSMLGTILGMLGLASLPVILANAAEVWDKISGAIDTLGGWLETIDKFFEDIGVKWAGMTMLGTAKAMEFKEKIINFKDRVKNSYARIKTAFKGFTDRWRGRIGRLWERLGRRFNFLTRAWNWVVGLKGRAIAGWSRFINTTWPDWKKGWLNGPWKNITAAWEKVQTKWGNIIKSWDNLKADWRTTLSGWRRSFSMTVANIPSQITAAMKTARTALTKSFDDWKKTNWTPISEKFTKWKTTFSSWANKIPGWEKSWFGVRVAWGVASSAITGALAGIPQEWTRIKLEWITMFEKFTNSVRGLLPKLSTKTGGGRGQTFDWRKYNQGLRAAGVSNIKLPTSDVDGKTKSSTTSKALAVIDDADGKSGVGSKGGKLWGVVDDADARFKPKPQLSFFAKIRKLFGPKPASFAESWLGKNPSSKKWAEKAVKFATKHPKIVKVAGGLTKFLGKAGVKGLGVLGVFMALMELVGLTTTWMSENDKRWNLTPFGNDNRADENFMTGLKNMAKIYGAAFIGSLIGSAAFGAVGTAIGGPVGTSIGGFLGGFAGGMIGAMVTSKLLEEEGKSTSPEIQAIDKEIAEIDRKSGYIGEDGEFVSTLNQEQLKRLEELQKKRTELLIKEQKLPATRPSRFGNRFKKDKIPDPKPGIVTPPPHIDDSTASVMGGAGSNVNSNQQNIVISYDSSSNNNNQASTSINETVLVSVPGPHHRAHDFYNVG